MILAGFIAAFGLLSDFHNNRLLKLEHRIKELNAIYTKIDALRRDIVRLDSNLAKLSHLEFIDHSVNDTIARLNVLESTLRTPPDLAGEQWLEPPAYQFETVASCTSLDDVLAEIKND